MTSIKYVKIGCYGSGVESGAIKLNDNGLYIQKEYNHIVNLINNGVC